MKKTQKIGIPGRVVLKKTLLFMRVTLILLLLGVFQVSAINSYSQQTRISMNFSDTRLSDVLNEIENQSKFYFLYNQDLIDVNRKVSLNVDNQEIGTILDQLFNHTSVKYVIQDRQIILTNLGENKMSSQQGDVSGSVSNEAGESLPGVTVVIKGTNNGTITDSDGKFVLKNVPAEAVLQFSFVGMKLQEIPVAGRTSFRIVLADETIGIDEVVAIAYGTQKKRDITGSVQNINAEELQSIPVGQFAQKLQGQIAGVQINQTTGQPGEGMLFRIRGATSINADNQPLFVVDGFPIVGGINNINPDEIESYTVLKDASATSLYGSRAGNGVILITTKRAKQGKTDFNFNAYYGMQSTPDRGRPDIMNAREFAQYEKEFFEDKINYEGWTNSSGQAVVPVDYQNPSQYGAGTDWYDVMLRTAPIQSYSLSATSRKGNFISAVVGSYFKQEGVLLNTSFERYSIRGNSEYQVSDKLKIGFNIAPSLQISQNQNTDGFREIIGTAVTVSPILSPWDSNGDLRLELSAPNMFSQPNWYRVLTEKQNRLAKVHLLSNAFLEMEIIKGLKYKFQAGIELENESHRTFTPSTAGGKLGQAPPQPASGSFNSGFYYSWLIENILTYNKSIKNHNFELLAGYTAQKYNWEGSNLNATDYPDDEISWLDAAATTTGGSSMTAWSMLSYISRLNYNYNNRYYFQATFRRDGSSRFGANNKWATFPSFSAGWIASDEEFYKNLSSPMNYLKVRASYGSTGNNNIGNYSHIAGVSTTNYVLGGILIPGKSLNSLGNSDLTWEETKQFDIGLDLGFFKDRIFLKYDYYTKSTDNLLYQLDIPRASGFSNVQYNVGQIDFWGHEFSIETKNLVNEVKWSTNINLSFNRNEVKQLGTENVAIGGYSNSGDINRLEVGQPVGIFMGYVNDGVYMTQEEFDSQPKHASSQIGTARMKDISGDGVIDTDDRTIIGNPNPDMIFGIFNEISWKEFDLSIVMSGVIGGDIIARSYENTENLDGVFNVQREVADRWRSLENPGNGQIPRTLSGTTELFRYNNTRWVSDGTHLALKNVTLGYTFSPKKYITRARIYFSGQQLAILTKYTGGNPEVSSGLNWNGLGVDNTAYPVPRTFTIGCNITF